MASPLASQSQAQPLTPPAEPSQTTALTNSQTATTAAANTSQGAGVDPNAVPLTSLKDPGTTKRPRDARLIHLILASMGVSAYQERVPLQLLDFAYRYTSSVLLDALYVQTEAYDNVDTGAGKGRGRGAGAAAIKDGDNAADPGGVSLTALRMAIGQRSHYQFQQGLPKEFLLELASKRNAVGLPGSIRGGTKIGDKNEGAYVGGVRLPHERYCLSGTGWGLKESWDSEGEEEVDEEGEKKVNGVSSADIGMSGTGELTAGNEEGDDMDMEEAAEREGLEDLFGGGAKAEDEDHEMGEG